MSKKPPNILLRLLWMIVIGWWLSAIFYIIAAILTLLIVTSPLGMMVVQKIGWAFSLYSEEQPIGAKNKQPSFILRFLYFIVIGWWLGGIALSIAWILGISIIGLPLSFMIMNRMGKIMTLAT